jgi:hypothetical protein
MLINGQFHAPVALSLGKEPLVAIGYKAGWALESVWTLKRIKISLLLSVNEP